MSRDPEPLGTSERSTLAATALIHLHRAEVARLTAYRGRLDITTNWAITSTALVTTFAFGQERITHAAFLFLMFSNYYLLSLEAHRYRLAEVVRERVRILELGFYPEVLQSRPPGSWTDDLLENLRVPVPPLPLRAAQAWRLRRNYLAIYLAVLAAWVVKLDIASEPGAFLGVLVSHARVGSIPGWLITATVIALYLWLAVLAWRAPRLYQPGAAQV